MSQQQRDDFLEQWKSQLAPIAAGAPAASSSARTATGPIVAGVGGLGSGSSDLWQTWDEHWPVTVVSKIAQGVVATCFRRCFFSVSVLVPCESGTLGQLIWVGYGYPDGRTFAVA